MQNSSFASFAVFGHVCSFRDTSSSETHSSHENEVLLFPCRMWHVVRKLVQHFFCSTACTDVHRKKLSTLIHVFNFSSLHFGTWPRWNFIWRTKHVSCVVAPTPPSRTNPSLPQQFQPPAAAPRSRKSLGTINKVSPDNIASFATFPSKNFADKRRLHCFPPQQEWPLPPQPSFTSLRPQLFVDN